MSRMRDVLDLVGRVCLAMIFVYEALDNITSWDHIKNTMTLYGITWKQDFLLMGVTGLQLVGSFLVIIGYLARTGATFLLITWLTYTFVVYSFWNDPPELQQINSLIFMKNMAISGGLMLLIAHGAGRYSVKRMIHVLRLPED